MQWNLDFTNLIKEEVFNMMNDFLQPGQNTGKHIEQKLGLTNLSLKRVWILSYFRSLVWKRVWKITFFGLK